MGRFGLPQYLTAKNRTFVGLGVIATSLLGYLATNHFPVFTPQPLPALALDQLVPWMPWTIWIYQSIFIQLVSAFFLINRRFETMRFLYGMLVVSFISNLIFFFYPTSYPRNFLADQSGFNLADATGELLKLTWFMDSPLNCFPSLHVSSCYFASFIFLRGKRRHLFFPYFVWATAISISTLTTKQHYSLDIAAGFGLAFVTYWFFVKQLRIKARTDRSCAAHDSEMKKSA
jgi:membrane-associated phospholipid phosphatase